MTFSESTSLESNASDRSHSRGLAMGKASSTSESLGRFPEKSNPDFVENGQGEEIFKIPNKTYHYPNPVPPDRHLLLVSLAME